MCAATFCGSLLSSLDMCISKNCQTPISSDNDEELADNWKVIPVPIAIGRRSDVRQTLITFCPDVWPSVTYCTNYACYTVSLIFNKSSQVHQIAGSQKCVRDRCDLDASCVLERCCVGSIWEHEQLMSRKRRVNDDVSQCIQSYCSGKLFRERILCIVKNCNRSA